MEGRMIAYWAFNHVLIKLWAFKGAEWPDLTNDGSFIGKMIFLSVSSIKKTDQDFRCS